LIPKIKIKPVAPWSGKTCGAATVVTGVALVDDYARRCALPGCDASIVNIPGRPERRYCTAAHRAAARQARRAAMHPEQQARLVRTLPWLAEPDPASDGVAPAAAPTRAHRSHRRGAVVVIGVVGILAGGYAITSSQPVGPTAVPVQGAPVGGTADQWAAGAEVTLTSVDRQLDVIARTEAAWNAAQVPQGGILPAQVAALQDRKALLERRRVTLLSQLDSYQALGRTRSDLALSQQQLDAVENALRNTSPTASASPDDEAALASLEEQRDLRLRQRDAKRAELAGLLGNVERATRTQLPDDGQETAAVSDQVMEVIHTGGREPAPTQGPRRPEVVASGREGEQAEERQATTTSAPPDPRGPRDESAERRADPEDAARAAAPEQEKPKGPIEKVADGVGHGPDDKADPARVVPARGADAPKPDPGPGLLGEALNDRAGPKHEERPAERPATTADKAAPEKAGPEKAGSDEVPLAPDRPVVPASDERTVLERSVVPDRRADQPETVGPSVTVVIIATSSPRHALDESDGSVSTNSVSKRTLEPQTYRSPDTDRSSTPDAAGPDSSGPDQGGRPSTDASVDVPATSGPDSGTSTGRPADDPGSAKSGTPSRAAVEPVAESEEEPGADQSSSDRAGTENPDAEQPGADQPEGAREEASGTETSGSDKPGSDKVDSDKVDSDKADSDKVDSDKVDSDQSGADKADSDKVDSDKAGSDQSGADKADSDQSGTDKAGTGKPRAAPSDTEKPSTTSRTGQPDAAKAAEAGAVERTQGSGESRPTSGAGEPGTTTVGPAESGPAPSSPRKEPATSSSGTG
jgi:hypothetical protein